MAKRYIQNPADHWEHVNTSWILGGVAELLSIVL